LKVSGENRSREEHTLKEWQFNVLFFVGVGGAVVLLIGDKVGIDVQSNPGSVTGIGAILTYVLTQRKRIVDTSKELKSETKKGDENDTD
jgi:hypothetical protein